MEIKFKRDTSFRKQFFAPDSFAHPAKMDAQLLIWLTEKYTKVGETILDPMFGSGTTMLACMFGRNVIGVDLEQKFVDMARANWEVVRMHGQLGYSMGKCQILQGDARNLEGLLVDKCIFSPPYAEAQSGGGIAQEGYTKDYQTDKIRGGNIDPVGKRSYMPENIGSDSDNISNLPYGSIDKIVTSPPYEDDNANLKARTDPSASSILATTGMRGEALGNDNIGNLKGSTYLEAMLEVYQQCYAVLKPSGLAIIVTKNFIRDKQVVRLDLDTIKLCEQARFNFVERHYRKLPSQSFWRVIYHQRHPEVEQIRFEDVLVFRKVNE